MKSLIDIVINSLKTRSEEQVTGGRGETLLPKEPQHSVVLNDVTNVSQKLEQKTQGLIISRPLCLRAQDLRDGMLTPCDYYAIAPDFKYCAQHATTPKPGERMKDEDNKGRKDDQEKPALAYIPKAALEAEGKAFSYGARKYASWNYRNGIAVTRTLSAALRHIFQFLSGEDIDSESGVHHLGCARANIAMALDTLANHPEFDDRYKENK
jgi:hypothetical protein